MCESGRFGIHADVLVHPDYQKLCKDLGDPQHHPKLSQMEKRIIEKENIKIGHEYLQNRGIS